MAAKKSNKSETDLLSGLNPQQTGAIKHSHGPLLIIAGAGTGKTTVITRRIAWLVGEGLAKPDEILALTFTDKAAGEMEERVDKLLPYGYVDTWISTFHSFGQRILERHGLEVGLSSGSRLLSTTQAWKLVYENFESFDLDYYKPLASPARFIHALLQHFSRVKDELITPAEYDEYAKSLALNLDATIEDSAAELSKVREIANAYARYQKLLGEKSAMDFGDLIFHTYNLFRSRPNILSLYRKKFKYILVDEFQDTNYAQYQLVKLLAGQEGNLTVVGDDDQAIYKFRGASVSNILKFKEDYPDCAQVTLLENYRSKQEILDIAYNFIQLNNPDRLEVKLGISKRLKSLRSGKGTVDAECYKDQRSEASAIVKKIAKIKSSSHELTWNDFAILARSNEALEAVVDELENSGTPYLHVSRRGLYRKQVIVEIISYLRLLDNYHESRALYRVINLPLFEFSDEDIAYLAEYSRKKTCSLFEAIKQPVNQKYLSEAGQKSCQTLLTYLQKHTLLARTRTIGEVYVSIVTDLGLAYDGLPEPDPARSSLLDQFYKKIHDFSVANDNRSLKDFMNDLELELSSGELGVLDLDSDIGPEAVKILTVHSAKGLEFRHVFVVALADKKFPAIGRSDLIEIPDPLVRDILPAGDAHIQEERRLFYVAMTRAKDGCYFSYAQDYGGSSVRKPSVFLRDIGLLPKVIKAEPTGSVKFPANEKKKKILKSPKAFSFSSISDFLKCPIEYKFRYVLKIPEPGSAAQSFGQTVHAVLEKYLNHYRQSLAQKQGELFSASENSAVPLPDFDEMLALYSEYWQDDWYETAQQKNRYRNDGLIMLKKLYDHFTDHRPTPKYLESKFKLRLGDYDFNGKIDRADASPDGLVIIDYKTGSGAGRGLEKVDREQLLIYQWAAQDFLGEETSDLQYWYLRGGLDIKSFKGSPEQIDEVKSHLLTTIEKIVDATNNDSFEKYHTKHQHCRFAAGWNGE